VRIDDPASVGTGGSNDGLSCHARDPNALRWISRPDLVLPRETKPAVGKPLGPIAHDRVAVAQRERVVPHEVKTRRPLPGTEDVRLQDGRRHEIAISREIEKNGLDFGSRRGEL